VVPAADVVRAAALAVDAALAAGPGVPAAASPVAAGAVLRVVPSAVAALVVAVGRGARVDGRFATIGVGRSSRPAPIRP
jgi:hypothetical protein